MDHNPIIFCIVEGCGREGHSCYNGMCMRCYTKDWRKKNPEKVKVWEDRYRSDKNRKAREKYNKAKMLVFAHYCGGNPRCMCCGETIIQFLSVEHIGGGGKKHRESVKSGALYQWLVRHNYPEGFTILCHNCNHGSYLNGGICPHVE